MFVNRKLTINIKKLTKQSGHKVESAALAQLAKYHRLEDVTAADPARIVTVSNKAAAITTSRHGAIPAMPSCEEVYRGVS